MKQNITIGTKIGAIAVVFLCSVGCAGLYGGSGSTNEAQGWLHWRGPQQNGTSLETNLPSEWERGGTNDLWSIPLQGRGTPVVVGERVYAWGYRGERGELREVLACLEAGTGKTIWEYEYSDYLSDVIYDRYAIGAPTIDADTGNVYLLTTPGDLVCLNAANGKVIWERALLEEFGRNTYPNGRTGSVSIDGDIAIIHSVTNNWGAQGPPRDRFHAYDKNTGDPVWVADPGVGPPFLKDSCFAEPVFAWKDGKRVFYCTTGDGNVACINARTGDTIWRYQLIVGGINSSPVLYGDKLIVTHGRENLDTTKAGGMFAFNVNATGEKDEKGRMLLGKDAILWRDPNISMFTSSPVLAGNRVYQVDQTGVLHCVNADTGERLWDMKLGTDQIHASPLWADGKLYVPMNEGLFYILKPTDSGAEVLSKVELEGNCLGAPAVWNGRVYVFTTNSLHCFGSISGNEANLPKPVARKKAPEVGPATTLQIIPEEVLLRPGESASFRVRSIDANGHVVDSDVKNVSWAKFVPPTARVKAELDGDFNAKGELVAGEDAEISAGAFKATSGDLTGTIRARIISRLPYSEDFNSFELDSDHEGEGVKFAYPPLAWIGARFKWEVRDLEGENVLAKTTDNLILQRAITFIGHHGESDYTMQADVRSDGNRRGMGEVGLIVQRYVIVLKGNHRQLEVSSNHERLKEAVEFRMNPKDWYTLKATVISNADGSGIVKVKAWPREESEPGEWTMEVPVKNVHKQGSPGFFGFSAQERFRVYVDNIKITPN